MRTNRTYSSIGALCTLIIGALMSATLPACSSTGGRFARPGPDPRPGPRPTPSEQSARNGDDARIASAKRLIDEGLQAASETAKLAKFREAVHAAPGADVPLYFLASALHDAGQEAESAKEYERCLEINPKHFEARLGLGELRLEQGSYDASASQFEEALKAARSAGLDAETIAYVESRLALARELSRLAPERFSDAQIASLEQTVDETAARGGGFRFAVLRQVATGARETLRRMPTPDSRNQMYFNAALAVLDLALDASEDAEEVRIETLIRIALDLLYYAAEDDDALRATLAFLRSPYAPDLTRSESDGLARGAGAADPSKAEEIAGESRQRNDRFVLTPMPAPNGTGPHPVEGRWRVSNGRTSSTVTVRHRNGRMIVEGPEGTRTWALSGHVATTSIGPATGRMKFAADWNSASGSASGQGHTQTITMQRVGR